MPGENIFPPVDEVTETGALASSVDYVVATITTLLKELVESLPILDNDYVQLFVSNISNFKTKFRDAIDSISKNSVSSIICIGTISGSIAYVAKNLILYGFKYHFGSTMTSAMVNDLISDAVKEYKFVSDVLGRNEKNSPNSGIRVKILSFLPVFEHRITDLQFVYCRDRRDAVLQAYSRYKLKVGTSYTNVTVTPSYVKIMITTGNSLNVILQKYLCKTLCLEKDIVDTFYVCNSMTDICLNYTQKLITLTNSLFTTSATSSSPSIEEYQKLTTLIIGEATKDLKYLLLKLFEGKC
jgi:hypothetical protein